MTPQFNHTETLQTIISTPSDLDVMLTVSPYIEGRPCDSCKVKWAVQDWWSATNQWHKLGDEWGNYYNRGLLSEQEWREGSALLHNAWMIRARQAERNIYSALEELETAYEQADNEMMSRPWMN